MLFTSRKKDDERRKLNISRSLLTARCRPIIVDGLPSFERPDSQLVTASQFYESQFATWLAEFKWSPGLNRKLWEYLYILNALDGYCGLRAPHRGLGFGVGKEQIPAIIAQRGCQLVITDYVPDPEASLGWEGKCLDDLMFEHLCPREIMEQRVGFRAVDMNVIPADLGGFDFLWSCGSLEHIGGLANGLAFVRNSMDCLKPGGIAVHTTEFTLTSETSTHDDPNICFYRRSDIEQLAQDLLAAGHLIVLNFNRGNTVADLHVDVEPFHYGLSLAAQHANHVITSIGLIIQKDGLSL